MVPITLSYACQLRSPPSQLFPNSFPSKTCEFHPSFHPFMQLEFLLPSWSMIYNFSSHYCFKFSVWCASSSSTRTLWCVYTWLDVWSRCCHLWYTVGLVKSCSQEVTLQPNRGHTTQSGRSYTLWCSCSSFQIGNRTEIVHHFIIIFFYLWYCIKKFGNPWVFISWNCPIVFFYRFPRVPR